MRLLAQVAAVGAAFASRSIVSPAGRCLSSPSFPNVVLESEKANRWRPLVPSIPLHAGGAHCLTTLHLTLRRGPRDRPIVVAALHP